MVKVRYSQLKIKNSLLTIICFGTNLLMYYILAVAHFILLWKHVENSILLIMHNIHG